MGKLYKDLKKGIKEIIAYKKGKITLKSETNAKQTQTTLQIFAQSCLIHR